MKKVQINKNGFTLVEVLVTILIIGIIGYILSDILVKSLSNGRKSEVIGNVKQNAQTALSIMDMVIRNSSAVTCTSPLPTPYQPGTAIVVLNKDGTYTRFWYQAGTVGPPATNGYIAEDSPTSANVALSDGLCDFSVYPAVNPVSLTDSSVTSGVSVTNGQFSVVQNNGLKDNVSIGFDFNSGAGSAGIDSTLGAVTHYGTTVQLR